MDKYVELIKAKDIGDKSKKVYLSLLSRLFKEGMKFPTKKPEKEKYVKEFLTKFEKPATRLDLLNVIIIYVDFTSKLRKNGLLFGDVLETPLFRQNSD